MNNSIHPTLNGSIVCGIYGSVFFSNCCKTSLYKIPVAKALTVTSSQSNESTPSENTTQKQGTHLSDQEQIINALYNDLTVTCLFRRVTEAISKGVLSPRSVLDIV